MGSVFEYLTIADTAKELGVTERTVRNYIRHGYLSTVRTKKNTQLVSRKDLRKMIEAKKGKRYNHGATINRVNLLEAEYAILRKQMNVLLRMNDMWDETESLNMKPRELAALHEQAYELLKNTWSPADEEYWVEFFIRLKMHDLDAMSELVEEHPWRPFYALCQAMYANPHNPDNKLMLTKGLSSLENIAAIWSHKIAKIGIRQHEKIEAKDKKQVRKTLRKVERGRKKAAEREMAKKQ